MFRTIRTASKPDNIIFTSERTPGVKPVCYACGKPGHIARLCPKETNTHQPHPVIQVMSELPTVNLISNESDFIVVQEEEFLNGFPVMATIDTGAAISAVSEKVLQTLKLEDPNFSWDITPWIGNQIAMANGIKIQPRWKLRIEIDFDDHHAVGNAVILPELGNPKTELLLGNDILKQFHSLVITYPLINQEGRELPGRSGTWVKVNKVPESLGEDLLVEPNKALTLKQGITTGRAIVKNNGKVFITNMTREPKILRPGTNIGSIMMMKNSTEIEPELEKEMNFGKFR